MESCCTNSRGRSSTLYSSVILLLLFQAFALDAFAKSLTSSTVGFEPSSLVRGAYGHRKLGEVGRDVSRLAAATSAAEEEEATGIAKQLGRKMQEQGESLSDSFGSMARASGGGGGYFGYGSKTTGGAGGPTVYVSSFADSGPGTLRYWCGLPGKRIIKFRSDATLRLRSRLECTNDKTVDGTGRKVIITGWGMSANRVSNVIFKGLCITGTRLDGVTVRLSSNVVVQGCTITKVGDGGMDVITESTGVSILNNHFKSDVKAVLIGNSKGASKDAMMRVTVAFNHFDNCGSRLPRVRWATVHVCSNAYARWGAYAIGGSSRARLLVERNHFRHGGNDKVNNLHDGLRDGTIIQYRSNTLNGARVLPRHFGSVNVPYSCPVRAESTIKSQAGVPYQCV